MRDAVRSARQYDVMAVDYAADNAESAFNAHYERPAMISLVGEVEGRRVLEVGCGAGPLTAWLIDHGAVVTAMDVSPAMMRLARERVGDRATFLIADLAQPLSFATDTTFDLVVASLVLHYVRSWEAPLREFRRVLKPDGAVLFSTHHPTMDWPLHCPDDYFAVKQVTETWLKGSREFEVTFWRRPLTAMTEAIASAGFVIERLIEPKPSPELRDRDQEAYELLCTKPQFLLFGLRPG
ncbi:MAG: class I SAM-dependent methyltransferase [Actinomycetota bacterium]|nr:class I SAM-dependent methyltransferase [Actinomycetota bacterium]